MKYDAKLIQRWIGAPQSGNLNDPETLEELVKDLPGLQQHLIDKAAVDEPAPRVPEKTDEPGGFRDFFHGPSPNHSGNITPEGVVFHHSAGSFQGTLSWCLQSKSKVSYHVLIHPDGSRHHMVPLTKRAWHAGKSAHNKTTPTVQVVFITVQ